MSGLEADAAMLEDEVWRSVHSYRQKWGDSVPVTTDEVEDILRTGDMASREDVEDFFEFTVDFYQDLFDVEEPSFEDNLEKVRYDTSNHQTVRDSFDRIGIGAGILQGTVTGLASEHVGLASSPEEMLLWGCGAGLVGTVVIGSLREDGTYSNNREIIGVSSSKLDKQRAFWPVAAETYHLFQYEHDSSTLGDVFLHEGSERAVSAKTFQEYAATRENPNWGKAADAFKTYTLIDGYNQYLEFTRDISTIHPLTEIGLTPEEADRSLKNHSSSEGEEYNLGASLILSKERYKEEVYREIFQEGREDGLEEFEEKIGIEAKMANFLR